MKVPLLDLGAQYVSIKAEIHEAIDQVLSSQQFILGPQVEALEREVAAYLGVEHAVGVASGTDALLLALRALNIGRGDEVIVPTYTFVATASTVLLAGATPVLVDVSPETRCIEPTKVAEAITPKTRAIVAVHLYGHPADLQPLSDLAARHNVALIEDNAQAFGAEYRRRRTGGLGAIGCLSFFPSKNLGGYGDGGMVVTHDPQIADAVRLLRSHGSGNKYRPDVLGYNSRLDELQAAVLRVKLRFVDHWNERRRVWAARYKSRLGGLDVELPPQMPEALHAFHLYVVGLAQRDRIRVSLAESGVSTGVYYPYPLHRTPLFAHVPNSRGDFPIAERAARECLALPLFPEMTEEQFDHVTSSLEQALRQAGRD